MSVRPQRREHPAEEQVRGVRRLDQELEVALHGGVRLALDSGEFILQRAAELPAAPSNLADMPPRACHFQTVPIEMLQQSTAVQWPFFNSSSLSFYREMASGRCNPLSMGSNLTVQGNRLTARAMGRGLRVALAGRHLKCE